MKVVNSPMEGTGKKKALLEDAPSSNVYSQLQKLTSQNPVCEYHPSFVQIESSSYVFCGGTSAQKHAFLLPSRHQERISCTFCENNSSAKPDIYI